MTPFEIHYYEAKGVRMRYYTAGAGSPLLFLHGGGVQALTYRKNLELLAQRFFVIAPDIPPFGASSMPPNIWNFIDYANFFSGFVDSLALTGLAVVGHSFGGGIAYCLAAQSPRVRRLVLIDAAGVSLPPLPLFFTRFFMKKTRYNLMYDIRLTLAMEREFMVNAIRKLPYLIRGIRIVAHALKPQYGEVFKRIVTPTLILWGGKDEELFPPDDARFLHGALKGSQLKEISGNHDWCLFQPERLYGEIVQFVYG